MYTYRHSRSGYAHYYTMDKQHALRKLVCGAVLVFRGSTYQATTNQCVPLSKSERECCDSVLTTMMRTLPWYCASASVRAKCVFQ